MSRVIGGLRINRETRTPLGATLHAVGDDLAGGRDGPKLVVFVTDGKETCKGDPEAEVARLVDLGVDVASTSWASPSRTPRSRRTWSPGPPPAAASSSTPRTRRPSWPASRRRCGRPSGSTAPTAPSSGPASSAGPPVALPAGTYRVEVLSEPRATFEAVEVAPGEGVELTIGEGATG